MRRSEISACLARISSSSVLARLVIEAIRLQNISARSSRTRCRATWTAQANRAVRFRGATSPMTAASVAHASPAKSAILDSAMPSSQTAVSPSESTQAMWATCSRNADHDARPADCFSRLNAVVREGPTTSNRASSA